MNNNALAVWLDLLLTKGVDRGDMDLMRQMISELQERIGEVKEVFPKAIRFEFD